MNWKMSGFAVAAILTACEQAPPASEANQSDEVDRQPTVEQPQVELTEITPGLSMRILKQGDGEVAQAGQVAIVNYTGWLYDEMTQNRRGQKFDSSLDRDEPFSFMLGARRVIRGWDQGVVGMKVGETRELTIAPELAYGDRGAPPVIPPGATLVFEVELEGLHTPE